MKSSSLSITSCVCCVTLGMIFVVTVSMLASGTPGIVPSSNLGFFSRTNSRFGTDLANM
jgi:hypothetical protein